MALNGSLYNLGSAAGGALGGLLLAAGGYGALGLGLPLFAGAAALLAGRHGRREGTRRMRSPSTAPGAAGSAAP